MTYKGSLLSTNFRATSFCSTSIRKPEAVWAELSMEQLLEQLRKIQQFALLYPPQGEKGPNRVALVLSKQTLAQQSLAEELDLNTLRSTQGR